MSSVVAHFKISDMESASSSLTEFTSKGSKLLLMELWGVLMFWVMAEVPNTVAAACCAGRNENVAGGY